MTRSLMTAVSFVAVAMLCACGGGSGGNGGGGNGGGSGVVSPPATHFSVTAPASATAGIFFNVTVQALDASNGVASSYSGSVHFASSDAQAGLPAEATLTNGTQVFGVALNSPGSQTVTVTDTVSASITGSSGPIDVAANANAHGFHPAGEIVTERAAHTATLLANGKILVTGGFNGTAVLSSAELFDPATGTSTATGSMNAARFSHTATLLPNGKVLITGGSFGLASLSFHASRIRPLMRQGIVREGSASNDFGDLATAEIYDPATGAFTVTGSMSEVRSEHTATLLPSGKVLVAGGAVDNVAELYDPSTGVFTPTAGPMVVAGSWGASATLLNDGTVLIAGGRDAENVWDAFPMNNSELYLPATGTFSATVFTIDPGDYHTATLLPNGQVLLAGGNNGPPLNTAELYDPVAKTYAATGNMNSTRAGHTATLLANGTVLLAGGSSDENGDSTAEIFFPTSGTFSATSTLGVGRTLHTATLLSNGDVIIIGGQTDIGIQTFTTVVEVYQ